MRQADRTQKPKHKLKRDFSIITIGSWLNRKDVLCDQLLKSSSIQLQELTRHVSTHEPTRTLNSLPEKGAEVSFIDQRVFEGEVSLIWRTHSHTPLHQGSDESRYGYIKQGTAVGRFVERDVLRRRFIYPRMIHLAEQASCF